MSLRLVLINAVATLACAEALVASTLIRNVTIVDGTGGPARSGSVRIEGTLIKAVGDLSSLPGETVIEGDGKVLAPGFIDTHSHHDEGLADDRLAAAVLSQGITTIVVGQDGTSNFPLADYFTSLEAEPPAMNVASYVGHGTLREQVLGDDFRREATAAETTAMADLLKRELAAGGLGLSTGLEYDPGIYAATEELIHLAKVTAGAKGRYVSHLRSEDRHFWEAIDEILMIGREARLPIQISHLKLAMSSLWGESTNLLAKLDAARAEGIDITADVYPYTYWQSTMTVLFPDRDFNDRAAAEFAVQELAPAETIVLAEFDAEPDYVGKTLAEVASLRGTDPAETLMALIDLSLKHQALHGASKESIIATSMSEDDVKNLLMWEHANVASDGYLTALHPRGRGAFPRFLGRYVRDGALMNLSLAIRKATSLAAGHMGIEDRGVIREGMVADLVLFDFMRVIDHATPHDPFALSSGIENVFVNGVLTFENGHTTGKTPGRVLRANRHDQD